MAADFSLPSSLGLVPPTHPELHAPWKDAKARTMGIEKSKTDRCDTIRVPHRLRREHESVELRSIQRIW
ncbi:MAG: hypothetical protein F4Y08_10025 [Caldilineaceae bacterium SB0662_bin_9]|uniref:Uncharacterized protein n=1 Tax=Caldilineaceae bacterium SB0662_bin_9 TaxID=2605258 RepID=A0A6B1DW93_9CHLR|nr:hypothetical protein [Caldilineaceae bacterium]MYD90654.1 hypothetical protein [Caldilineaceae bacterium SB0662_bin_9]